MFEHYVNKNDHTTRAFRYPKTELGHRMIVCDPVLNKPERILAFATAPGQKINPRMLY